MQHCIDYGSLQSMQDRAWQRTAAADGYKETDLSSEKGSIGEDSGTRGQRPASGTYYKDDSLSTDGDLHMTSAR